MRTYYFYQLNEFKYPKNDFDYYDAIKSGLELKSPYIIDLANDIVDGSRRSSEKYLLDNGHDARFFIHLNEIKQISEESYNRILEDEKRILNDRSDKALKLMSDFGITKWHNPFKIEASDYEDFWFKLKKIFPEKPIIHYSSTVEGKECLYNY